MSGSESAGDPGAPANGQRARIRASELLQEIADNTEADGVTLGELLDRFGRRGFGVMLFLGALPALIPSPVAAGALAAPVTILCGLQLALGKQRPWLPRSLSDRRLTRTGAQNFLARAGRLLRRTERLARPRWMPVLSATGSRVVGALIAGHGVALSAPLPFTNYPFAFIAMLLAVALLEDDGLLASLATVGMIVAMTLVAIAAIGAVTALL